MINQRAVPILAAILSVTFFAELVSAQSSPWDDLIDAGIKYYQQGHFPEAEKLYLKALKKAEQFGSEDRRVATTLNNLSGVYRAQGKYAQAEGILIRALDIDRKTLQPINPNVAIDLNNLAVLYRSQGKYALAEPLQQQALAIHQKALGPKHRSVAIDANNLAGLYTRAVVYSYHGMFID